MVTRSSSSLRQMRSIPCYTKSLVSISAATSCRVASLFRAPSVLDVHPSVPANTVPEFVGFAKANPGKLTMASSGIGTASHVFGELFKFMTGVNLVHVPYRGAASAVTDLLAGQVQVFFDPIPNSIGYIRTGKVRPLAITSAT